MTETTSTLEEQTEVWADYVAARARADASLCIRDGIAAAQAWKRFLNLFLDDDHKVPVVGGHPFEHRSLSGAPHAAKRINQRRC